MAIDYKKWFEKAEKDVHTAKFLIEHDGFPEIICFHCQQGIEKSLKGFLQKNAILPEKIHNLYLICKKCLSVDCEFSKYLDDCKTLTDYYIESRYPVDLDSAITRQDAEDACGIAQKIHDFVKSKL